MGGSAEGRCRPSHKQDRAPLAGVHAFVSGGAGFIGSILVERLLRDGARSVVAYDNLSLGRREYVDPFFTDRRFRFAKADLLDAARVRREMRGCTVVFHMAANSDIGAGEAHTDIDLRQGTIVTYNVLEAARRNGIRDIVFASSSAVFGEAGFKPLREDHGPLRPISLYGASKLACEALCTAFAHIYGMRCWIYRFANIVGEHTTHGAVHDFIARLRKNPRELRILGDGTQRKPYLYVRECVAGMLFGYRHAHESVNVFNLGCRGSTTVKRLAEIVVREMDLIHVRFRYTGGDRGWKSDVPKFRLDPRRLAALGWRARLTSDQAVVQAVRAIVGKPPLPQVADL